MKPIASILVAALLLVPGLAMAKAEGASDPRTGTWKLNITQSIPPQGKSFAPFTAVVHPAPQGSLDFTYRSELPDGQVEEFGYRAQIDGVLRDLPGNMRLKGAMTPMAGNIIRSLLRWPDGTEEDKICNLDITLQQQTCIGIMTSPQKDVVFFKQVLDKQG